MLSKKRAVVGLAVLPDPIIIITVALIIIRVSITDLLTRTPVRYMDWRNLRSLYR